MKTQIFLKSSIFLMIGLAVSSCKKDFSDGPGNSLESMAASLGKNVNAHIEYSAVETSYKKYQYPLSTEPTESWKLTNTYPITRSYDFKLDLSPQSFYFEMDKMGFQSPVPEWNQNAATAFKIVNDGNTVRVTDRQGNEISNQPSHATGFTQDEIYALFAQFDTKTPLEQKLEQWRSKGAEITDAEPYYFIKITADNPNFDGPKFICINKTDGKSVLEVDFDHNDPSKKTSLRMIKYNVGQPVEIYDESYEYLADGDIETSIRIQELKNPVFTIN